MKFTQDHFTRNIHTNCCTKNGRLLLRRSKMKKFKVYPGYIRMAPDGRKVYFNFKQLCKHNSLNPDECLDMSHEVKGISLASITPHETHTNNKV